jgi:DNA-binding NarL/FixJ family response regulator
MARAATLTADDVRRAPRALAAAQLAWRAGNVRLASTLLRSARGPAVDPVLRLDVERLRAAIEFADGSSTLAYEILLAAASEAERLDPARAAAMLLDATAVTMYGGDARSHVELGRRAERLRTAARLESFDVAVCAGLGRLWGGDARRGRTLLEQAIRQSESSRNPRRLYWAAVCALHIGDSEQALAFTMRDANLARDEGVGEHLTSALLRVAFVELIEGWLDAAARSSAEGLELATRLGLEHAACAQHALHAWIAALRGHSKEVEEHAAAAVGQDARQYAWPAVVSRIALGELALGYGHSLEALTYFQELSTTTWATPPYLRIRAAPGLIEAAVRTGQPDVATAALQDFEQWATSTGSRTDQAVLARCRALHAGDDDEGRQFEEALRLHADVIRPFDRARTELLYGESLRRAGRRSQAREHLRLASRLFAHLGAASWATRAEAELRATGETLRARTETSAMDLTPQELQIARLVATGATNKAVAAQLFLSPRTVDAHLRTVFRKLGISSRRELSGFRLGDPV